MKRAIVLTAVAVSLGIAAIALTWHGSAAAANAVPAPASTPLIVHEWGTFTGLAGSDGLQLPFLTRIGFDLPPFVSNRLKFDMEHGNKERDQPLLFVKAGGVAALQRMETPVIYFYTDRAQDVDVRVDFPRGLLTEFYPPVRDLGPRYGQGLGEPRPISLADGATRPNTAETQPPSFIDWDKLHVMPQSAVDGAAIPAVGAGDRYGFARQTDSALVQFVDVDRKTHQEKFLFYRGVGNIELPVRVLAKGGDRFEVVNASGQSVRSAFLVYTEIGDAAPSRFFRLADIAGSREVTLPPASDAPVDLGEQIVRSLVAEGLFEKEAKAMVATWKSNWLGEPGTRLLYILPRRVTDDLLPLHISPTPAQTTRVLIGRIDILTPEVEARLRAMIPARADDAVNLSAADVRLLESLGRFLDPAMHRVAGHEANPATAARIARLMQAFYEKQRGATTSPPTDLSPPSAP